jgi:ubiquinone/menaquinone biosynthesis C-methylase UbiE
MDVRDLKYEDNTFDLAVDKSTIDALLCGEKSFLNVAIMLKEVQRVLKVGGVYVIISYGQPENRVFHLEREHLMFDINIYTIKKDYCVEENSQSYEKV